MTVRHHRELFENVRKRTGMYVVPETYEMVAAFVFGYDCACEGGLLAGFREWLVLRLDGGANLAWPGLVLDVAFPRSKDRASRELSRSAKAQRHAIDTLFTLIDEFDSVRAERDGLKDIYVRYDRWQAEQAARPV